ncbi:MAG: hypothetical protein K2U26_12330 [Cyclobacteriaceae bacterium]|nr:hypothetical protein [Cyclobacteriaceae bacterium]
MITKQYIAQQLLAYMSHQLSLADLVGWAESAIMNGGYEPGSEAEIRQVLGKLGAANVSDFGLLWEDCEQLMRQLGYKMKVEAALVL